MSVLFQSPILMLACFAQVALAVIILIVVTEVGSMRPDFSGGRAWRRIVGPVVTLGLCLSWLGVLFGALFSGSSIIFEMMGDMSAREAIDTNLLGVVISRMSGVGILAHIVWIALRAHKLSRVGPET